MAPSQKAEIEAKLAEINAEIEAIEALEEEIRTADTIGDTRLSKLFHEARTTSASYWSTATAFCQIEDGEVVVKSLDKLSDGRWAPETRHRFDVILSVGIRPFMSSELFIDAIESELWQNKAGRLENKGHYENHLKLIEHEEAMSQ